MKWLISRASGDGGRRWKRKRSPINQWLSLASSFLSLPFLLLKCRRSPALTKQSISHQQYRVNAAVSQSFLSWAANELLGKFLNLSASRRLRRAKDVTQSPSRWAEKRRRSLLCCPNWGSWCPSSRSRTSSRMRALWWDCWRQSTSHSLQVAARKCIYKCAQIAMKTLKNDTCKKLSSPLEV